MSDDSKVVADAGRPKPPNAGKGRPKGVPNKVTRDVREAIRDLLETAGPNMVEWLDRVADEDPGKALDLVAKFAEYVMPKLSRQVVKQPGALTLAELVASAGAPTEQRQEDARALVDRALSDVDPDTRERTAALLAEQPKVAIVTGVPDPDGSMTSDEDGYEPILQPRGGDTARYLEPEPQPERYQPRQPEPRPEAWFEKAAREQAEQN